MNTLKPVIASNSCVKVGHDVSHLSSSLFFQYGIESNSVYDTQIAQTMVYNMRNLSTNPVDLLRCLYSFYPTLVESADLQTVLKVDPTDLSWSYHDSNVNNRQEMWNSRPLSPMLLAQAMHSSAHLIRLSKRQREKLLDPSGESVIKRTTETIKIFSKLNVDEIPNLESAFRLKPGHDLHGLVIEKLRGRIVFDVNLPFMCVAEGLNMEGAWGFEDCEVGDVVHLEMLPTNLYSNPEVQALRNVGEGSVGELAKSGGFSILKVPKKKKGKNGEMDFGSLDSDQFLDFPREICVARKGFKGLHYDRKRNKMMDVGDLDVSEVLEVIGHEDPFYANIKDETGLKMKNKHNNQVLKGSESFESFGDHHGSLNVVSRGRERWNAPSSKRREHIKLEKEPDAPNAPPKVYLGQKIYLAGKGGRFKIRDRLPEPRDDNGKNFL
eukprot:GDKJ01059613.1.p1 GENE.GDKJ01059613.1~~GDKJ01059613.1.p1  ORF type:complete len:510 (+),score=87.16 GDKJ01059613.1:220-1530(+)